LQKKLETVEYNPFGKAGGGAPNLTRQQLTINGSASQPSNMQMSGIN